MKNSATYLNAWVFLCLMVVLCSCDKEEEVPDYPVTMTFDTIAATSDMRVYAGVKLLDTRTDSAVIAEFLDRYYSIGSTFYNSRFEEPGMNYGAGAQITFFADGRIRYATEITEMKREYDAIIMKSTVTNEVEDSPLVATEFYKFPYDISKNGRYDVHHIMYGDERSALDVTLLYYKLVRYNKDNKLMSVDFGTSHNEFNEDFLDTLTDRDTLALKSYRLKYSVK
ncbi:hypothetical protein [Echinicola vietnamensis]|uniref:NigD-like protein n=1 Tax=Echinicola vietnamensis (strain DSM 17526 / LMG 23754 / KMM 6221) TaxID=926556 RepID=L0FS95_ECHVK|nr:hypothetical protein [Echinicola vietnamensis]AGA76809.1 hypothetical protein Echvi_0525 [Echinicola vietnamensis DSM 17526]